MKNILDILLAFLCFIAPHTLAFLGLLASFNLAVIYIRFFSNWKRGRKK